ncbi:MAG: twin-arginine translocase subunit TatC [Planctomycetia bacterium]|nr:twin-arginine translocase subunit TatC [Planctomycetia bacterium]
MEDARMTFGEHLEDLRRRLIYALLGIAVCVAVCAVFYKAITREMLRPYYKAWVALHKVEEGAEADQQDGQQKDGPPPKPAAAPAPTPVQNPSPSAIFIILVKMCLILGIVIASPWVIYQIWRFVAAGLYPNECRMVYIYGPFSFLLFIGGAAFFFLFILPLALQFLMSIGSGITLDNHLMIENRYLLNHYFSFVAWMTLVFGISFETPLVVMFLARTGIVPFKTLLGSWRWVVLGGLIVGALLTPPDVFTMVALGVPLIALYGLGLLLALLTRRPTSRTEGLADEEDAQEP